MLLLIIQEIHVHPPYKTKGESGEIYTHIFSFFLSPPPPSIARGFLKNLRFYLFIFRDRGREGGGDKEKHQFVVASHAPPTGDLARHEGMCPDWGSNRWPVVRRPALNPLSHISQVEDFLLKTIGKKEEMRWKYR